MRSDASTIDIIPLAPAQVDAAARLFARAFVTNPLHIAAFGAAQPAANEAFFRSALAAMRGPKFAVMDGTRMVGALHWVRSPGCRFSPLEKLRMMPGLMRRLGARSALRVGSWLSAWAKLDPGEPHLHLGPIGVEPEAQGRGIGRRMMDCYCRALDEAGVVGYLETDRPSNVEFYRRFGFEVIATAPVLGVPNYFMRRAVSA
jgi:ribosomal protein S18 acetylase RimI-like enzyme